MVAGDADAGQDLQSAVHDVERGLGAVVLGHRAVAAREQAIVVLPGDLVEHVAHVGQAHLHLSELQLDELVAGDRLTSLDTLVGVLGGVFERAVGGAVVGQGDEEALKVEVGHTAAEAVALGAEEVLLLKFDIVEVDVAARVHAQAELAEGLLGDARQAHVDEPLGVGVHVVGVAGHDDQVGGVQRGRDEGLVSVEVDLAVLAGVGGAHVIPRRSG